MSPMLSLGLVVCFMAATQPDAGLTPEKLAHWSGYIRPKPQELAFEAMGWKPTFMEAVVEAQKTNKPILLWVMNGHPLACT